MVDGLVANGESLRLLADPEDSSVQGSGVSEDNFLGQTFGCLPGEAHAVWWVARDLLVGDSVLRKIKLKNCG